MSDEDFDYDGDLVHLAVANADRIIGDRWTPTRELVTACKSKWSKRPRRTMRHDLITCPTCVASLAPGETPRSTAPPPPITHVAVRVDGQVWSLPKPFRHHHIIRVIADLTGAKRVDCSESRGDQGFLDASGRYLPRKEALPVALANKQVKDENDIRAERLFSEDVW